MEMNIFALISILGLVLIITGITFTSSKKTILRKYSYLLLITGGICLEIYSIHINDLVFTTLQGVFIISSIYGLIKINTKLK